MAALVALVELVVAVVAVVAVAVDTAQPGQEAEAEPESEPELALAAAAFAAFAASVAAAFAAFAAAAVAASIGVATAIVAAARGPLIHLLAFHSERSRKTTKEAMCLAYETVGEKAPQERSPYDAETCQHHCHSPHSIIQCKWRYLSSMAFKEQF